MYECSGAPGTWTTATELSRPGGTLILVGASHDEVTVLPHLWMVKELTIDNSFAHLHHEFALTLDLMARGRVHSAPLHDTTVGLDDLAAVFADLARGADHVKVLVDPRV